MDPWGDGWRGGPRGKSVKINGRMRLTKRDASEKYKIPVATLSNWIGQGKIKEYSKSYAGPAIDEKELKEFLFIHHQPPKGYVSVKTAAELCKCGINNITALARRGVLSSTKYESRMYIEEESLRTYMENRALTRVRNGKPVKTAPPQEPSVQAPPEKELQIEVIKKLLKLLGIDPNELISQLAVN